MAQLIRGIPDPAGDLTWLQTYWSGPVQRLFWIHHVPPDHYRGGHRHPTGQMALCCLKGSVRIYVQTPSHDQWYILQSPTDYLLLAPQDWRLMDAFNQDAVLMVLAEKPYTLTDYIEESYRSVDHDPVTGSYP